MKGALARADRGTDVGVPDKDPAMALISPGEGVAPGPARARRKRLPAALRAGAPTWLWLGTAVAAAGFVLIAIGWGQVAAEVDVYRQLPYLVSAGLIGLGLVLVGLAVLNIASRQRDAMERDRQVEHLVLVMEELRELLADREGRS